MLSRFFIPFLPRSKCLLISWLQSPSVVIFEPKKIVSHCFHCFPSICHAVMGLDAMFLVFWMLSFKPTFSFPSFTFIKRLFSSSSLSAISVVSSAYLRLLIFFLEILIPACASFSLAFLMMHSAYKLNKQGDNIRPWHTPFPKRNQFSGHYWVFQICCHIEYSTFKASPFRIWNSSAGIPSPPLDLFVMMLPMWIS